jgi:hypothetical protein
MKPAPSMSNDNRTEADRLAAERLFVNTGAGLRVLTKGNGVKVDFTKPMPKAARK